MCLTTLAISGAWHPLPAQERIEDNSFLIEEAYNQERGVVQHISTFARGPDGDWTFAFTQEWPVGSQRHQLSYTIPVQRLSRKGNPKTGLGDIAINYRYQLLGGGAARAAFSPRLSILLSSGDATTGHGAGGTGLEANLPFSYLLTNSLVTHLNVGFAMTPGAKNALGASATTTRLGAGASLVYLATPSFNLMLEAVWRSEESVQAPHVTTRASELLLNPGVRFALNSRGGLQVVPGISYPMGLGSSPDPGGILLYLSFEHAFAHD